MSSISIMQSCIHKKCTKSQGAPLNVVILKLQKIRNLRSILNGIVIQKFISMIIALIIDEYLDFNWISFLWFRCDQCDKKYAKRSSLIFHQNKHFNVDNKQYVCPICGKVLSQKFYYSQHIASHSKGKNEKCPHCDKRYVTLDQNKVTFIEIYHFLNVQF